jgi:hypothetical protein
VDPNRENKKLTVEGTARSPFLNSQANPGILDEGQTLAIMDMEKLKKMQQSVRIGEFNPLSGLGAP